jgi:hypothetical protein
VIRREIDNPKSLKKNTKRAPSGRKTLKKKVKRKPKAPAPEEEE